MDTCVCLIMPEYVVALTTCPVDKSEDLARSLVEEKVCACVNIISGVKSIYHWKDEIPIKWGSQDYLDWISASIS